MELSEHEEKLGGRGGEKRVFALLCIESPVSREVNDVGRVRPYTLAVDCIDGEEARTPCLAHARVGNDAGCLEKIHEIGASVRATLMHRGTETSLTVERFPRSEV